MANFIIFDEQSSAVSAIVEASYSSLTTLLNSAAAGEYKVGQSFFIVTVNVPDIWISSNNEVAASQYTYTSDADFIAAVNEAGGTLQIGHHKVSFLETEKVNLNGYLKYAAQELTAAEKSQARINIGAQEQADAVSADDWPSYSGTAEVVFVYELT